MPNVPVSPDRLNQLPGVALAFLLGACLLHLQPSVIGPVWTSAEILMLIPICLWLFYTLPARRSLISFALGFLWALLFAQTYIQHSLDDIYVGKDILLQGVVSGVPEVSENSTRFDFLVEEYQHNSDTNTQHMPERLRLSWYYQHNTIRSGDRWRLLVRLKPPHGMQNPGGFDYEKWLYQQGIHATGYIRKSQHNQRIEAAGWSINRLRQHLHGLIMRIPDSQYQGILQALTLGVKSSITTEQWSVLRNTGTSHLMAISGLHIGLVAGMVFFLMRKLVPACCLKHYSATQIAAIFSLLVAGFYALLAGFSVPTQRAFIMLLVIMLALMLKRPAFSLNTMSLALIAVIAINPVSILSVGFWLSFIAVFIISLVSSGRTGLKKAWLESIRIQWMIALGMLPLSLLLFQQGSLISPLANMLVIPLVGMLIVPMALLASFCSLLSADLSVWLFSQTAVMLSFVWQILDGFSNSPLASLNSSAIPLLPAVLALVGVLLLLLPRGFPLRYSGLILILPMLLYKPLKPAEGAFWLTVLDVGQGLAVLVQTRDKALLYDAGAKFSERFDIGQRVIVPFLQYSGIDKLDTLLISHADNDHAGGADAILKELPVAGVLSSPEVLAKWPEVTAVVCQQGYSWQWQGVNFEVLHPDKPYKKSNNRSCVLRVSNEYSSVLLTGDIEKKVEKHLLSQSANLLQADVLLVPHHGSNTSSTRALLDRVKPDLAIVSAGYKNRFNHPARKVMARYEKTGIRVLNTAIEGAIQIKFPQNRGLWLDKLVSQRKLEVHYWNHRF